MLGLFIIDAHCVLNIVSKVVIVVFKDKSKYGNFRLACKFSNILKHASTCEMSMQILTDLNVKYNTFLPPCSPPPPPPGRWPMWSSPCWGCSRVMSSASSNWRCPAYACSECQPSASRTEKLVNLKFATISWGSFWQLSWLAWNN